METGTLTGRVTAGEGQMNRTSSRYIHRQKGRGSHGGRASLAAVVPDGPGASESGLGIDEAEAGL